MCNTVDMAIYNNNGLRMPGSLKTPKQCPFCKGQDAAAGVGRTIDDVSGLNGSRKEATVTLIGLGRPRAASVCGTELCRFGRVTCQAKYEVAMIVWPTLRASPPIAPKEVQRLRDDPFFSLRMASVRNSWAVPPMPDSDYVVPPSVLAERPQHLRMAAPVMCDGVKRGIRSRRLVVSGRFFALRATGASRASRQRVHGEVCNAADTAVAAVEQAGAGGAFDVSKMLAKLRTPASLLEEAAVPVRNAGTVRDLLHVIQSIPDPMGGAPPYASCTLAAAKLHQGLGIYTVFVSGEQARFCAFANAVHNCERGIVYFLVCATRVMQMCGCGSTTVRHGATTCFRHSGLYRHESLSRAGSSHYPTPLTPESRERLFPDVDELHAKDMVRYGGSQNAQVVRAAQTWHLRRRKRGKSAGESAGKSAGKERGRHNKSRGGRSNSKRGRAEAQAHGEGRAITSGSRNVSRSWSVGDMADAAASETFVEAAHTIRRPQVGSAGEATSTPDTKAKVQRALKKARTAASVDDDLTAADASDEDADAEVAGAFEPFASHKAGAKTAAHQEAASGAPDATIGSEKLLLSDNEGSTLSSIGTSTTFGASGGASGGASSGSGSGGASGQTGQAVGVDGLTAAERRRHHEILHNPDPSVNIFMALSAAGAGAGAGAGAFQSVARARSDCVSQLSQTSRSSRSSRSSGVSVPVLAAGSQASVLSMVDPGADLTRASSASAGCAPQLAHSTSVPHHLRRSSLSGKLVSRRPPRTSRPPRRKKPMRRKDTDFGF